MDNSCDTKVLLSIIVPVYNVMRDNLIKFCLDSLSNQTLLKKNIPYEIICVDDCSPYGEYDYLENYSKNNNNVRVFHHNVNKKQGAARNTGIKNARGKYITFVDSDDFVDPEMYETLICTAEQTNADVVGCDICVTDKHEFGYGKIIKHFETNTTGNVHEDKYKRDSIIFCGTSHSYVFLNSIIKEYNLCYPENTFYEDSIDSLWMYYFHHLEIVNKPYYYYYINSASTSHKLLDENHMYDRINTPLLLVNECKKRHIYENLKDIIDYKAFYLFEINNIFSIMSEKTSIMYKLNYLLKMRDLGLSLYLNFSVCKYYRNGINKYYRTPYIIKALCFIHYNCSVLFFFISYYILQPKAFIKYIIHILNIL